MMQTERRTHSNCVLILCRQHRAAECTSQDGMKGMKCLRRSNNAKRIAIAMSFSRTVRCSGCGRAVSFGQDGLLISLSTTTVRLFFSFYPLVYLTILYWLVRVQLQPYSLSQRAFFAALLFSKYFFHLPERFLFFLGRFSSLVFFAIPFKGFA